MARTLAIGTEKGAWFLEGDRAGEPEFPGWKVTAFGTAPDGTWLAGLASNWFGSAIHRRVDGAWEQAPEGPAYAGDSGRTMKQTWTFTTVGGRVYAGVDEAGLFSSDDHGRSWQPVPGLNDHRTREQWGPGLGGLCAHRVLAAGDRVWVAISAVGVFRSDDGGRTFEPHDRGIAMVDAEEGADPPEVGYCVHGLAQDPDHPARIWRQDHTGVYRTDDGGDTWERTEAGLPAGFGFPMVRDHASGRLFVVPLHSDMRRMPVDGRFAAWRSDDDGETWQRSGTGWPDDDAYGSLVLRGAMVGDGNGTIALGTTSGEVWRSDDAGDHWRRLPVRLPRILSVALLDS